MEKYEKLFEVGKAQGDTNFCTVISTAVAFDKSFDEANQFLRAEAGRRFRSGPTWKNFQKAVRKLADDRGWEIKTYNSIRHNSRFSGDKTEFTIQDRFTNGETMTVNNCLRYLNPKKRYILGVSGGGHALAVEGGKIQDWTNGRRHQVMKIMQIEGDYESPQKPEIKPIIKKASMSLDDMISLL